MSPLPIELRDLARSIAADIADYLGDEVAVGHAPDTKSSSTDFVTAIDREAERRIVEAITMVRPDDAFMGEEGTDRPGTTGVRWVIDPIDGTTNFVHAHPGFCVSIAAEIDGVIVAGAVADPMHDELFDAALGEGARCNGEAIAATPETDMAKALVATGFSYDPDRRRRQAEALMTILPRIADIRRMGSAATDLCSVAIGRVDASFEMGLNHWDLAAGALIAAEAGAVVRWPGDDGLTIAAAPGLADELIPLIESVGIV